ncbi:MAG: RNA polymerase sigma factor SigM [Nocardioidaceae bacterium]
MTDEGPDDATLMARHVAGDPDAFGIIVQRHRDRLWAVAIRTLGDREEAADALQDALVSAFRRAESYRGDAAVTTWMHRIVVNACLDRIRRRKARPAVPLPEDEDRMEELGETLEEDPAAALEERSAVLQALRTLPEPQRAAIVLVDMEGYPVEEAARILDCAVGTIKSRCARGRAKLLPLLRHLRTGNQPSGSAVPPATVTMLDEQRRGGGDG